MNTFRFFYPTLAAALATACAPVRMIAPDDALAREMSALRALDLKKPIEFVEEDSESIARGRERASSSRGLWSPSLAMFGLALSRTALQKMEPESTSGLAGYFDHHRRRLHVDASLPKVQVRHVLRHELGHALQYDHGLLEKIRGYQEADEINVDEFYGWKALIEGDPTFINRAANAQLPLRDVIDESVRLAQAPFDERLRFWGNDARAGDGRLPLHVHFSLYQYYHGAGFVAEMVRAGGVEFLRRVYRDPPRSTEHILHPEKYLSGDDPIEIPKPSAPPGYGRTSSDTLGELGIRAVLNTCYPLRHASDVATGWGGDTYVVFSGQKKELVLLWSTVWDDEAAAARFAVELERCWKVRKPSSWAARPTLRVTARGARVYAIRGLPEVMIDAAIEEMAAAKLARPERRARHEGPKLLPAPQLPALATLEEGTLADEHLGVRANLPAACRFDAGHLLARRMAVRCEESNGTFGWARAADERARTEIFLRAAAQQIGKKPGRPESERNISLGLGEGTEKIWRDAEQRIVRVTLIPACGGERVFSFSEVYTEKEEEHLDAWRASFALTSPAAGCADPR